MFLMFVVMALPVLGLGLFWVLPWPSALPLYLAGVAISALCHWAMHRAARQPVQTGREAMIGALVEVRRWREDRGSVRYGTEIWSARSPEDRAFEPGERVAIRAFDGLTLVVTAPESGETHPG